LPHCGHFDNTTRTGKELVTCALDGCIFSAGGLRGVAYDWLRDNLKRKNETVVVIHANYLKGNAKKREKLKVSSRARTDCVFGMTYDHCNLLDDRPSFCVSLAGPRVLDRQGT
jgi:hypothetical protein